MKKVLHIKSKVVENNLPKLPNYDQILYGEIAINYKDGYETLSIRNDADEVVTFSCDNSIIKLIRENSIVPSSGLTKINDNEVIVKLGDYLKFDQNSGITLVIDDELDSGSTNPISNSAITKVIYDNELVVSSALNDLEENKQNKLVAGNGISISDDVISYTGESQSVTAGSGVTITNGSVNVKLSDDLKFDSNSALSVNTDSQLSLTSNKPISNSAVTSALNAKQDAVTFESGLTANNGKVSVKLGSGLSFDTNSGITVNTDNALSTTSNNLVPNSVITNAINSKQNTLNTGSGVSITNDTINVKLGNGISFDANSALTVDSMTIDDELNIQSTNPVSNSAITQAILDNEEVTSSALNDLKLTKQDVLTAGNGISIANNVVSYTGQSQSLNAGSGISIVNDTINVKLGDGIAYDANSALTVNVSSQFVDATGDTMSGKLSITNGGIEVTGDSKINGTLSATTININDINGTNVNGTNVSGTTVKGNTISAGTYTNLPTASTTTFGVMKVGNGLNVTNGVVSVASVDGDYVNATGDTMSGKLSITNGGLDVSGNTNINGTLSATSINTPNLSITNVSGTTVKGSTVSATTYNNLPTATTTNFGVVKVGSGINVSNGTISVDDEYENVIETVKVNNATVTPDANKTINIEVPTSLSGLSDDATHRLVTDTEKSTWNGKVDKANAISALSLSLNTTDYKLTLSGTRADGTNFTVSDVVDLPLESVVVGGRYDAATKKVILSLQNGNTIDFSVADLVSGLQTEITSTNKLSADLISDGTTNKTVTASEKNTWNNKQDAITDLSDIRRGAELGETALQTSGGTVNGTLKVTTISATTYNNLPTASTTNFGVVKVGSGLDVTNGTISVDGDFENTIETVKVNGTALTPDANKAVNVEVPTKVSDLTNDSGFITGYTETDPTVPAWAKQSTKPTYTASEVGALPDTTVIPTALSDLTDDATHRVVTDTEKAAWNSKGTYSKPTGGIPATDLTSAVQTSLGKADTAVQRSGDTMSGKLSISNGGISVTGNSNVNGTLSATTMSGTTVKGNTVSAGTYNNLPSASTTSFGVVKVGNGLGVSNGVISVTDNFVNTSGDTMTGKLSVTSGGIEVSGNSKVNGTLSATTFSGTTIKGASISGTSVSGGTVSGTTVKGATISATTYQNLPLASSSTTGVMKVSSGLVVSDGAVSVSTDYAKKGMSSSGSSVPIKYGTWSKILKTSSYGVVLIYIRINESGQANHRTFMFTPSYTACRLYQLTAENYKSGNPKYQIRAVLTPNSNSSTYDIEINEPAWGGHAEGVNKNIWVSWTVLGNNSMTVTPYTTFTEGSGTVYTTAFESMYDADIVGAKIYGIGVSATTVSGTTVKGDTVSGETYQNLPTAATNQFGIMKIGNGLSGSNGTVSVSNYNNLATLGYPSKTAGVPIEIGKWCKVARLTSYGSALLSLYLGQTSQSIAYTFNATNSYNNSSLYQLSHGHYTGNEALGVRLTRAGTVTTDFEVYLPYGAGGATSITIYLASTSLSITTNNTNTPTVTPYTAITAGASSGATNDTEFTVSNSIDINNARISARYLRSTVANGTQPLVVSSTTLVSNLNADKLDGMDASGLFTSLSNSGNNISVTIGGTNKTLQVGYATSAGKATTLANSRTIWGQNFNGSANVSGNMTGVGSISASGDISTTKSVNVNSGTTSNEVGYKINGETVLRGSSGDTASLVISPPSANGSILFYHQGTADTNPRSGFNNEGFLGIRTIDPQYALHVSGSTKSNLYYFSASTTNLRVATSSTLTQFYLTMPASATSSSMTIPLLVETTTAGATNVRPGGGQTVNLGTNGTRWNDGYFKGNLSVSGTVTSKGAMYSSDRRLKENIEPISVEEINKLDNVDVIKFNFKTDDEKRTKYGVIAQDVEEAGLGNLVSEDKNGSKSVDYISLLMLQIEKLNRKIDDMEKKHKQEIDELKNKIDKLSSKK